MISADMYLIVPFGGFDYDSLSGLFMFLGTKLLRLCAHPIQYAFCVVFFCWLHIQVGVYGVQRSPTLCVWVFRVSLRLCDVPSKEHRIQPFRSRAYGVFASKTYVLWAVACACVRCVACAAPISTTCRLLCRLSRPVASAPCRRAALQRPTHE